MERLNKLTHTLKLRHLVERLQTPGDPRKQMFFRRRLEFAFRG